MLHWLSLAAPLLKLQYKPSINEEHNSRKKGKLEEGVEEDGRKEEERGKVREEGRQERKKCLLVF